MRLRRFLTAPGARQEEQNRSGNIGISRPPLNCSAKIISHVFLPSSMRKIFIENILLDIDEENLFTKPRKNNETSVVRCDDFFFS